MDNTCAPTEFRIAFLHDLISASEQPFCHGAFAAVKCQSNPYFKPNYFNNIAHLLVAGSLSGALGKDVATNGSYEGYATPHQRKNT